jgi:Carboxypeptidase regulatory-like domain
MMKKILCRVSLFLLFILSIGLTNVVAQSTRGVVTGTVKDSTGSLLADADVTLSSPSTGISSIQKTNKDGIYRFEAVTAGDYIVSVASPNFGKQQSQVTVTVGALVGRDFTLTLGSVTTTLEVNSAAAELQTEDAVRSATIPATALAELPIVGQNSLNLIMTVPGAVRSNLSGSLDSGIGAINGARARSNNFLIDGLQNNDISVAGPQFSITNNDELQEVNFQTSNFSPEFGRAGGAVVSQITKSGTNQLHGTIAEIYRSEVFNATTQTQRINFANGSTPVAKNKFKENIPAFTIGGPVILPHLYDGRDKTFFFGAAQWDRFSQNNNTTFAAVPTANGVAVLQALASSCPNVTTYLASLGPIRGSSGTGSSLIPISVPANFASTTCTGNARTGQTVEVGQYVRNAPEVSLDNNHLVRIDHVASAKQNLMFRWLYDNTGDNIGGVVGINPQFDIPFTGRTMGANFNHVYAFRNNLVNEFRFGYVRSNLGFFIPAGNTLAATAPAISITSLSTIQLSSTFPQGRTSNSFEYQESLSYTHGRHALKGGVEFLRQLAVQVAPFNGRGTVAYNLANSAATGNTTITGLANFIDNYGGTAGATAGPVSILFGTGRYHPNLFTVSAYFQDTFKLTPNLTVVYGTRYENFGQPANIFKYPAFVGYGDTDITSTAKVNHDNNNWGPTVGFSYSPNFGNHGVATGGTVIRGGYQVTYDTFFNNLLSNIAGGSPNALPNAVLTSTSTVATPRGLSNLSSVLPTLTPVLNQYSTQTSIFKQSIRNPYYHHFSFGVQQQLPGGVVLDAAYVGSLGRQLFFTNPVNPVLPNAAFTATATQTTPFGVQPLRVHANRGTIQIRDSGLTSNYHSLQVQVRRSSIQTMAGRLAFTSSYTWSKNLDILTETFATNSSPQNPSRSPLFANLRNIDYGPSDNDRRHVWSTLGQLDLRGPTRGVLQQIFGGWSVAPILTVQSGTPYTVTDDVDRDLDGSTIGDRVDIGNIRAPLNTRGLVTSACPSGLYNPAVSTTPANACVNSSDVHFVQVTKYSPTSPAMELRNSNRTTRYLDLDANLIKKFPITERFKAELRGEFFNVTNNQNFDTPVSATNRSVTNSTTTNFLNYGLQSGGSRTFRVGAKILF